MSSGIAHKGATWAGSVRPAPLPVQVLDHATGYLAAAAAVRGLTERHTSGRVLHARLSLARVAKLLVDHPPLEADVPLDAEAGDADFLLDSEATGWGPAKRLRPPLAISGCPLSWDLPAGPLRSASPRFETSC
ncbi:unnamed protein product [Polarella glacialis]|uniref:Uncharacterized protein n=1 Tax=Polarella glacialis TaxID=89957 RepID=A0A813HFZ5_POLGL|nr:unnamed protein product [Polarella glacialis]